MRGLLTTAVGLIILSAGVGPATAQTTVTIFFDGEGDEIGITDPGTTDFSYQGSNWTGGIVDSQGILPLYASGFFSYHIDLNGGEVTFDEPLDSVEFFYVHGFGFAEGTATAFDADDNVIGEVDSNEATFFADPRNFETMDPDEGIARIEFSGAIIDNFTFTTLPPDKPCEGDANDDGTVDPLDSGFVLARFGCPVGEGDPSCDVADQNGDGAVDPLDVGFVLARFGPCDG